VVEENRNVDFFERTKPVVEEHRRCGRTLPETTYYETNMHNTLA